MSTTTTLTDGGELEALHPIADTGPALSIIAGNEDITARWRLTIYVRTRLEGPWIQLGQLTTAAGHASSRPVGVSRWPGAREWRIVGALVSGPASSSIDITTASAELSDGWSGIPLLAVEDNALLGPQGEQGIQGIQGIQGPPGASAIVAPAQVYGDDATDLDFVANDTIPGGAQVVCRSFTIRTGATLTITGNQGAFRVKANTSIVLEAGAVLDASGQGGLGGSPETVTLDGTSATGGGGGNGGDGGAGALGAGGFGGVTLTSTMDGLELFQNGGGFGSGGGWGAPETDPTIDPGGVGGNGGGSVVLAAPIVQILGSILARGLDGQDAPAGAAARGGGGSGGGGSITLWGAAITLGADSELDVSAGAVAGTGSTGGDAGTLGAPGTTHTLGNVTQL